MAAEADCNSIVATPPQEHLRIEQSDSLAQNNQNPSGSAMTSGNLHMSPILPQRIGFEPSPAVLENHSTAHSQGPAAHSSKKPATKVAGVRKRPSQKAKAAEMVRQQQEETEEIVAIMIQQQQQLMALFMFGVVMQQRQQSSCGIM
jgi:hypothetical protein